MRLSFSHRVRTFFWRVSSYVRRSQWPRGLRRRSSAARPLRLWVRIPPGAWMTVCCEFYVLSGRGLCDGLITHPEESYRLWRVVVCDLETSNEEAKARYGVVKNTTKRVVTPRKQTNNNKHRHMFRLIIRNHYKAFRFTAQNIVK